MKEFVQEKNYFQDTLTIFFENKISLRERKMSIYLFVYKSVYSKIQQVQKLNIRKFV